MRALLACALALLAAGCDDDPGTVDANLDAPWQVVAEDLPEALLAAWSDGAVVYAVGADKGAGPAILRLRDGAWQRLDSGARGDLWWVDRAPDGALWMVGEAGLVLRHDPADDSFRQLEAGTDRTLYGVELTERGGWIVGGDTDGSDDGAPRGVLLRVEGDRITSERALEPAVLAERALFKVWARADDDVWFVGEQGLVLRYDGRRYTELPSQTRDRLLTVSGAADQGVWMVGGQSNARLLRFQDGALRDHSLDLDEGFAPALNGVHAESPAGVTVVGNRGFLARLDRAGRWRVAEAPTELHLHAAHVEDDGRAWAVGGAILSDALDRGVLLVRAAAPVPPFR